MAKVEFELEFWAQVKLADEVFGTGEVVVEKEKVHDEGVGFFVVSGLR